MELRSAGASQSEAAAAVGTDRSFVSRVESLGEIRQGERVALVGFPVKNKEALARLAAEEGIDAWMLFTDEERRLRADSVSGAVLFNEVWESICRLREYDKVIFIGSDLRIRQAESILGPERVIGIELGPSPILEDREVDLELVGMVMRRLKGGEKH